MNEYKISFTAFPIDDRRYHFSGCKATIYGETFDEAIEEFRKKEFEKGYVIGFIVEGDIATITFYDMETGEEVDGKDLKS